MFANVKFHKKGLKKRNFFFLNKEVAGNFSKN